MNKSEFIGLKIAAVFLIVGMLGLFIALYINDTFGKAIFILGFFGVVIGIVLNFGLVLNKAIKKRITNKTALSNDRFWPKAVICNIFGVGNPLYTLNITKLAKMKDLYATFKTTQTRFA